MEREGGRRRIDRVLAPEFATHLERLDLDEVRRRRDECLAEREYLSFLRRLLQGRMDILSAERERRRSGGDAKPLVEQLADALADRTRGPSRGEAPLVPIPDDEIALARRRIEKLAADISLSDPGALTDEQLEEALVRLGDEEREVSATRARVFAAHDALQGEVKRRYRAQVQQQGG